MIKKPIKKHHHNKCYNYQECEDYIENKYKIKIRDYAGKWSKKSSINTPYQDYWHFILKKYDYIKNDSFFDMEICYMRENAEPWQNAITDIFEKEFANDGGIVEFFVSW